MKRVSNKLLFGAVFALLMLCDTSAQANVSILSVNAARSGNSTEIEVITTGPAVFKLDRLDDGTGLFAWADNFNLDSGFGEIPLDLARFGLGDFVERATMVNDAGRSGIRLYPGPYADFQEAWISADGSRTTITIPVLPGKADMLSSGMQDGGLAETAIYDDLSTAGAVPVAEVIRAPKTDASFASAGGTINISRSGDYDTLDPSALDDPEKQWPEHYWNEPQNAGDPDDDQRFTFDAFPMDQTDGTSDGSSRSVEVVNSAGDSSSQIAYAGNLLDEVPRFNFQRTADGEEPPAGDSDSADAESGLEEDMGEKLADEPADMDTSSPFRPVTMSSHGSNADITFGGMKPQVSEGMDALSKIRINFYRIIDSPLDEALSLLVANTDFNLIVDSSVGDNKVSLEFKENQTDLKSALDLITQVYGLEYVVRAGTIVIASKEKMEESLIAHEPRMFVLSYAHPQSIKEILINTNLVTENQVEIYAGEQEYPEVSGATELSSESAAESTEVKAIHSNLDSSPRNALLVRASPDDMEIIARVIRDLDRKPKIIELEVRVCEAGENALRDLGIELNSNQSTPTATSTLWTEQPKDLPGDILDNQGIEAFTAGSFHRSPLTFLGILNTQIQDGKVELLAQPTLTTLEGKQAIYFAGERIPYIAKVAQTQTGQQIEVDFLNVGITLNFKPRLDAEGKLTIDVNPIVSSLLEFRIIGGLVEAPRTSSRQAATTVRVSDREPFVLAGLINETERTTVTKVPLLGDLPLVGKLFRNKNKKGERTEIIVVVTPIIRE